MQMQRKRRLRSTETQRELFIDRYCSYKRTRSSLETNAFIARDEQRKRKAQNTCDADSDWPGSFP